MSAVSTSRAWLYLRVDNLVRVRIAIRARIPVAIWWRHRSLAHFHHVTTRNTFVQQCSSVGHQWTREAVVVDRRP